MNNNNTTEKSFLMTVLSIAVPVSLQALICNSLSMIDQMMIGQLGETCVAAVSLAGKVFFILSFALGGICAVSSIYASQAEGAGESSRHALIMKTTLLFSFMCTVPFFVLSFFFPEITIKFFTRDSAVISKGAVYLRIVSVCYFPTFLMMAASSVLRSTGHAKIPLVTGFISVLVNSSLNAVLIFGLFGFSAMGEKGAAYATIISRFLETLILVIFMRVKNHPAEILKSLSAKVSSDFKKKFFMTSLPAMGNELLWAVGNSVYAAIYGHLGTASLASMTLTDPVQCLSIGLFSGLSTSASIIIGNKLGAGKFDEGYVSSWKFLKYSVIGCSFIAVLIALISPFYVRIYNVSPDVKKVTVHLLLIFCVYFMVKVSNMIIGSGIIRSGGETKYSLFLDVLGTYGIGLPLGFIFAFLLNLPVEIVYAVISFEEIVRFALGIRRIKSRKWISQV